MSKQLIVCASNWSSFVSSLKSNLKLGYGVCTKTSFSNGFFRGILEQGTDRAYVARLASVSGDEIENIIALSEFLCGGTQEVVEQVTVEKKLESVNTKVKRIHRPKVKK